MSALWLITSIKKLNIVEVEGRQAHTWIPADGLMLTKNVALRRIFFGR